MWKAKSGEGKYKHISVVYGQANQKLSQVYRDTLMRCKVAAEELTDQQKELVKRMQALLQEEVEVEDFLTGEKTTEYRQSRLMKAYDEKKTSYENAVIDYAQRLSRANNGTAADLVEWSRSGGIYKQRAIQALNDWIGTGYKREVERAQATINHILGGSMVDWKSKLLSDVEDIDNNMQGTFGYPFFPAAVLPGSFARNQGWAKYKDYELHRSVRTSSTSKKWGARGGLSYGLFSFGGSAGGTHKKETFSFEQEEFGLEFEYTQVEITRPAFNANFFLSRGWKPDDSFIRDYQTALHSDGKKEPKGAMVGYPTKALFIRDLTIYSRDFAKFMQTKQDDIKAGASFGWGPLSVGGNYQQSDKETESNLDVHEASITVKGLQLVAFISSLFPYTANPSEDVEKWI